MDDVLGVIYRPERYAARTQSTRLFLRPFDAHSAHQWVEKQLTPLHERAHALLSSPFRGGIALSPEMTSVSILEIAAEVMVGGDPALCIIVRRRPFLVQRELLSPRNSLPPSALVFHTAFPRLSRRERGPVRARTTMTP